MNHLHLRCPRFMTLTFGALSVTTIVGHGLVRSNQTQTVPNFFESWKTIELISDAFDEMY